MHFFNLDLHISVIEDIKDICTRLYGDKIQITNWSISGHNWVFNKPTKDVKHITAESWLDIDESLIKAFQDEYDEELKTYDGFIVTHTPVFALLFEKYKKPILIVNTCRYDQPFCMDGRLGDPMKHTLDTSLKRMTQSRQALIVSNNRYDQWYLKNRIEIDSTYIPSLCLYTKATYAPTKQTFVLYGNSPTPPSHPLLVPRPKDGYTWEELYSYKGIVHLPYEMSTMSLFEQISACVPVWFPTPRFYLECIAEGTMEFITLYHIQKDETFTVEQIIECFERSDIYTTPYIHYYDSYEDLYKQLEEFEDTDSEARKAWVQARTQYALTIDWPRILIDLQIRSEQLQYLNQPSHDQ